MAKIKIEEVTNGSRNDQVLWVCDYRYEDISNKPIRAIKPTRVLVRSNTETKKTVYYSNSHFVGLNAKDEPVKSKLIKPYDNTGFRSYPGVPINIFDTEAECVSFYKEQVNKVITRMKEYLTNVTTSVSAKIGELEDELKK